jgi:DNA-binding MarR family transcriptional regulator
MAYNGRGGEAMESQHGHTLRESLRSLVRRLGLLERSDAGGDVTLAQCHAIVEIGRAGSLNLNTLAASLCVDKSTMSRMVGNLESAGFAARDPNHGDRRYLTIRLTDEGQTYYRETEAAMEAYYAAVLNRIPAPKRQQVLDSLSLLNEALAQANGGGSA